MKCIVMAIASRKNNIVIEITCINDRNHNTTIDNTLLYEIPANVNLSVDYLSSYSLNIINDLINIDYYKKPVLINLGLNMIIDSISLPKMTNKELSRYFDIEVNKLYPNYENEYVHASIIKVVNNQMNKISIAMCDRQLVAKLFFLANKISSNIAKVQYLPVSLSQFNQKYNLFKNIKNGIFVNFGKNITIIGLFINNELIESDIVTEGTNQFNEVLNEINSNNTLEKQADEWQQFTTAVREVYRDTFPSIIKLISMAAPENKISNIYINCENVDSDLFARLVQKKIRKNIIPMIPMKNYEKENLIAFSSINKVNPLTDFIFPTRVKL